MIAWVRPAGWEDFWLEGHGVQTDRSEGLCAMIVRQTFSGQALSFNQQGHDMSQLGILEQSIQVVSTPLVNTVLNKNKLQTVAYSVVICKKKKAMYSALFYEDFVKLK